jgi:hypothetical protein
LHNAESLRDYAAWGISLAPQHVVETLYPNGREGTAEEIL